MAAYIVETQERPQPVHLRVGQARLSVLSHCYCQHAPRKISSAC